MKTRFFTVTINVETAELADLYKTIGLDTPISDVMISGKYNVYPKEIPTMDCPGTPEELEVEGYEVIELILEDGTEIHFLSEKDSETLLEQLQESIYFEEEVETKCWEDWGK